tara:strand:+ start:41 stop:322 length:282 start_codon:yes stop_codon:yes gene_type:complete
MPGHIKYPSERKRSKNYMKDTRMVHIVQLPQNEHLMKCEDNEYLKRYSKEWNRINKEQIKGKRNLGIKYSPTASEGTACELTVKKGIVTVSFD